MPLTNESPTNYSEENQGRGGQAKAMASQESGETDEDGKAPSETKVTEVTGEILSSPRSWGSFGSTSETAQRNSEFYDSYNQDWESSARSTPSNISSHSLPCMGMLENYYSVEVNPAPMSFRGDGATSRTSPRRSRTVARQLSYPATGIRARSLSRARDIRFRMRMVSEASLHTADGKGVPGGTDEEVIAPKEEWQYKPLSFMTLPRQDKVVLISLGMVDLTLYMCLSILAPFFPKEAQMKGVNNTISGWIFGVFALTQFITSPIFGYLCPKLGSRFLFISGHFIAGSCTVLFGFLDKIPDEESNLLFIVFCFLVRIMLALGCTASATASFAIMANTFPDNVATVFGILETFTGVGLMVGPALGGVLYEAGGFAAPFVSLGGVMLLSVPFLFCTLKRNVDEDITPGESSSVGQILCIPAVLIILLSTIIGSLIWAILDPILEPHLRVYNLSASMVGLIFLLASFFYALSAPFWGWIADKVTDSTPMLVFGFIFSAFGLLLLAPSSLLGFPHNYRALWLDLVSLMILGTTSSLALVPTFEKILDAAEKAGIEDNFAMYGAVAGLWGGAYALGEFIGPSAGGFIVDKFGFEWCMIFAAAPCVLTAFVLLILWIYEKKVGPTPCLIRIPPVRPVTERTPLLSNLEDTECDTLPPSPCDNILNNSHSTHSSSQLDYGTNSEPHPS